MNVLNVLERTITDFSTFDKAEVKRTHRTTTRKGSTVVRY